jgi:serine/threonine protein kinase
MNEISRTHARVVMNAGGAILKLYPNLVDVSVVVANMNLARTRIPLPEVYDYGYSGNCAYILMQWFPDALTADQYIDMMGCKVPRRMTHQVQQIVAALASVGLSHNDLYPRNLLVDRGWKIVAVIDWDDCTEIGVGGEYARRVAQEEMHDWDHIFLKHSRDKEGEIILFGTHLYHQPPLAQYPLGRPHRSVVR